VEWYVKVGLGKVVYTNVKVRVFNLLGRERHGVVRCGMLWPGRIYRCKSRYIHSVRQGMLSCVGVRHGEDARLGSEWWGVVWKGVDNSN
jgi:hypothetical protein